MQKILLFYIFQPFAQFRNPFTIQYAQTFPLPPPSTITGMLQNLTGEYYSEEFVNLEFSIHGLSSAVYWNYQRLVSAKTLSIGIFNGRVVPFIKKDSGNDSLNIQYYPLYYSTPSFRPNAFPTPQQELFNNHFFILVRGSNKIIDKVIDSLDNLPKILYLGRSEDVAYIRSVLLIDDQSIDIIKGNLNEEDFVIENKEAKHSIYFSVPTYLDAEKINAEIERNMFSQTLFLPIFSTFRRIETNRSIKNRFEIDYKNTYRDTIFSIVKYIPSNYHLDLGGRNSIQYQRITLNFSREYPIRLKIIDNWGWLSAKDKTKSI